MKRTIGIAVMLLLAALPVLSETYQVIWNITPNATGYKVFSTTNGTTWKLERVTNGTSATLIVSSNVIAFGVAATNTSGSESVKAVAEILFAPGNVRVIQIEP